MVWLPRFSHEHWQDWGACAGGGLGSLAISLPFYVTAGLIMVSGSAVYFLLPESLAPQQRTRRLMWQSVNAFAQFKDIFGLRTINGLLLVGICFYAGLGVFQVNFIVFLKDIYRWGPAFIGSLLTLVGVCDIATWALLLPWLLKRFSQKRIGIAGLVGLATGLALVVVSALLPSVLAVSLALMLIISGAGLFEPTYNGTLSDSINQSQQGKLQGVNQSLQAANNVLVPLGAAAIYLYRPGVLYALAALFVLATMVVYARHRLGPPNEHHQG